ncbi:MAG: hypothetical protein HY335_10120 [Deinococcus sp.]|nr:hypothetical protein [Deinococcus sp.]
MARPKEKVLLNQEVMRQLSAKPAPEHEEPDSTEPTPARPRRIIVLIVRRANATIKA